MVVFARFVVVLRPREPLNTTRRLLLAIPPEADLEPGFQAGVGLIKRLSHQLSAPVMVLTEEEGAQRIFKRLRAIKPDCDLVPGKLPRWAGLRRVLQEHYRDGDLIVLLGARQGGLAWKPVMTRLPEDLADTFPKANLLVVYAGEPDRENTLSIVNPEPATRMA